jgi:signal peptidase I
MLVVYYRAMTTLPPENITSTPTEKNQEQSSILSLIITGVLLLSFILFVRFYIAKPFIVSGLSMYPTFNSWHYLIIDEFTYNFKREPERGEVIVFHYPGDTSRFFIKRVIGLPGETVSIDGHTVTINGDFILDEPYVIEAKQKRDTIEMTLAAGEYFVLGDNRKESADSRYWGPLEREHIVGRALTRLFPFTLIDWLPGEVQYVQE